MSSRVIVKVKTADAPRRDTLAVRRQYQRSRLAEKQFARQLRALARRIGELTHSMFDPADPVGSSSRLSTLLHNYGRTLQPWAKVQAQKMVLDVTRKDDVFWAQRTKAMGNELRYEIRNAPTGIALRERSLEAAAYITSLPLEAAERIRALTVRMLTDSSRAHEAVAGIMRSGHVSKGRAQLIARTEVARTAGLLTEVRAKHVGSTHYIWRTAGDSDVRELHKHLNGQVFSWDEPPVTGSNGERSSPGGIYNCRCWAEVILTDED
jgi:SPP1 gp7 family putative phage head morphogenesis protein